MNEKISKWRVFIKVFWWAIGTLFIVFVLMFLMNLLKGTYKSFKDPKQLWISMKLIVRQKLDLFIYVSVAGSASLGIFIFWKQIKNLGNVIKNYLFGSKPSKHWLWNCKTKEGSKKEFKKKFAKQITGETEPNWLFSFTKNKKWFYVNDNDQNTLVNGPPGSGKTQRVLLPNIEFMSRLDYKHKPNLIVNDPKKEIVQFTGKTLESHDYKIYAIDFSSPKESLAWNPLSYAWDLVHAGENFEDLGINFYSVYQDSINKAYEEIINVTNALAWSKTSKDSMWQNQAKKVIVSLTKFLLLYSIENPDKIKRSDFNLETVASMVNLNSWENEEMIRSVNISGWLEYTMKKAEEGTYYWKKLWTDVEALSKTPHETLGGIFVEANSVLMVFVNDEELKRILRETKSFNLQKIVGSERIRWVRKILFSCLAIILA